MRLTHNKVLRYLKKNEGSFIQYVGKNGAVRGHWKLVDPLSAESETPIHGNLIKKVLPYLERVPSEYGKINYALKKDALVDKMQMWEVDVENTEKHYLHLNDPDGWYTAQIKDTGLIHFYRVYNVPLPVTEIYPQQVDYMCYLNIDEEIERLIQLKNMAKEHFGKKWNE